MNRKRFGGNCAQCGAQLNAEGQRFLCPECKQFFCTQQCYKLHECGRKQHFVPWDNNHQIHDEEGDELIELIMTMVEADRKNADSIREQSRMHCIVCEQTKEVVTDDDPYSVCADCYNILRNEFLNVLHYSRKKSDPLVNGFRVMQLPGSFTMDKMRFLTLLLTKKKTERRHCIHVHYRTPRDKGQALLTLYDLKIWELTQITVLEIRDRIFEFSPGGYLIIRDE